MLAGTCIPWFTKLGWLYHWESIPSKSPFGGGNRNCKSNGYTTLWFFQRHGSPTFWRTIAPCYLQATRSKRPLNGQQSFLSSGTSTFKGIHLTPWIIMGHQEETPFHFTSMVMKAVESLSCQSWCNAYSQWSVGKDPFSRTPVGTVEICWVIFYFVPLMEKPMIWSHRTCRL